MSDTSSESASSGFFGFMGNADTTNEFNKHSFLVDQKLMRVRTNMMVKIVAVHADPNGGPPTVDVMPLVNQVDGIGNKTDHGVIYGLVTHRAQSGDFAIINDPVVNDIGSIAVHDRDISSLKANGGDQSNPGSMRRHDPADGMFVGQTLNKKPNHFIQVTRDGSGNVTGIAITSPAGLNFNGVKIDTNGNLSTPGSIQAGTGTGDSVTLQHHIHPGTAQPVAGT
jgi:hypothetical protein